MAESPDLFYKPIRQALSRAMTETFHICVAPDWIGCPAGEYPARSAAPLRCGANAGEWASILQNRSDGCGVLFGEPLVEQVLAINGHLLFRFTPGFYTAALKAAVAAYPPPKPLWNGPEPGLYAFWRMRMLARKPGRDCCPDNFAIQRAAFLALGIPERLQNPRLLRLRVSEAANALLTMTHGLPRVQRPFVQNQCALVGDAAARLLYCGLAGLE